MKIADRREFLRDAARYAVAGAMFCVAGVMIKRAIDQECLNHRLCNTCMVFDGCELPYKQADAQPKKAKKEQVREG